MYVIHIVRKRKKDIERRRGRDRERYEEGKDFMYSSFFTSPTYFHSNVRSQSFSQQQTRSALLNSLLDYICSTMCVYVYIQAMRDVNMCCVCVCE